VRSISPDFRPYLWATSTPEAARIAGIRPEQVLRFDANTAPHPPSVARPEVLADALSKVHGYPHGGYAPLVEAIAAYAGVDPESVVLGAGADDLLLLCARSLAGPGDRVSVLDEPVYPLLRVAVWLAGAEVGEEGPAFTFCCRPHNPTGALGEVPAARPLVVDEAYYEYCGDSAAHLLDEGVIVVRTLSKAFRIAGARVGYALADRDTARELNDRQAPAPLSTLSAALALAVLAEPPDVQPVLEERERLADGLRALGLEPLPSAANFLYVPLERARQVAEGLLRKGMVVRDYPEALRITVLDQEADERLLRELEVLLAQAAPVA
jgi:histidinol-phosphate aminotransferase